MDVDPVDSDIIEQVREGDVEAFRVLVDRYWAECFRYATRVMLDPSKAEDAVQESWIRAFRALPRYREQGKFRAWLFRILANRCRTHAVRDGSRQRVPLDEVPGLVGSESEEDRVLWRDEIGRALGWLSPLLREAFVLRHVEELSYEEMAEVTGDGVSALKMRVARARQELRNRLEEVIHDR